MGFFMDQSASPRPPGGTPASEAAQGKLQGKLLVAIEIHGGSFSFDFSFCCTGVKV